WDLYNRRYVFDIRVRGLSSGHRQLADDPKGSKTVLIPETTFVDVESRVLIPETTFVGVESRNVCTLWRKICKDPAMWRVINMNDLLTPHVAYFLREKHCKHVIDRSQGQLVDITFVYHYNDALLQYVAERACKLCVGDANEERLTSYNETAVAIGGSLHELRHLELIGNKMSNIGLQKVCTLWRKICKDPAMWRVINMNDLLTPYVAYFLPEKLCKHVIDRSQGQLVDVTFVYDYNDALLQYVADRSSALRYLKVICTYDDECQTIEGLTESLLKFPLLEELSLYMVILDGCRHLETLDLRECFYIDFKSIVSHRSLKPFGVHIDGDDYLIHKKVQLSAARNFCRPCSRNLRQFNFGNLSSVEAFSLCWE
nr:hypothetical protein [Tanacetum cinerariifolium]